MSDLDLTKTNFTQNQNTGSTQNLKDQMADAGAEILCVPNGSPFDWPKPDQRMNVAVARVKETGLPLIYLNQIGTQQKEFFRFFERELLPAVAGEEGGRQLVQLRARFLKPPSIWSASADSPSSRRTICRLHNHPAAMGGRAII